MNRKHKSLVAETLADMLAKEIRHREACASRDDSFAVSMPDKAERFLAAAECHRAIAGYLRQLQNNSRPPH